MINISKSRSQKIKSKLNPKKQKGETVEINKLENRHAIEKFQSQMPVLRMDE